jgi:hypothetical protein
LSIQISISNAIKGSSSGATGVAPLNVIAPLISGVTVVGYSLSTTNGSWVGESPITYTYQWYRGATLITGATSSSYTLVNADEGQSMTCVVTATNAYGFSSATSNSLTVVSLLLDLYTSSAVAYSLRKLRTAYSGSAIQVRRSSDNTTQDIGFDLNGNLDTSSLLTFCGAGNGSITTWYDQSGNSNNATQTTIANQGQIVSSGSIVTDPNTGKISVIWSSDFYLFTGIALTQLMTMSAVVNRVITSGTLYPLVTSGATNPRLYGWGSTGAASSVLGGTTVTHETSTTIGAYIMSALRNSSNVVKAWKNTTALTTGTASSTTGSFTSFGQISATGTTGRMVEMIYWNNDKESSRTDIVTNQNDYWEVY